jgi:hypothetical protein
MADVKRSGRILLNALTVLSLMLFAALAAVWVDHRVRTEVATIIRPSMELEISLADVSLQPGLRKTVDFSGQIDLPLLGKMKAAGLTCAQLESEIDQAFRDMGETKLLAFSVRIVGFQPPGALVMGLLLAIPVARVFGYGWTSWKRRRRIAAGLCSHCGYDVRATPERCPECGETLAARP